MKLTDLYPSYRKLSNDFIVPFNVATDCFGILIGKENQKLDEEQQFEIIEKMGFAEDFFQDLLLAFHVPEYLPEVIMHLSPNRPFPEIEITPKNLTYVLEQLKLHLEELYARYGEPDKIVLLTKAVLESIKQASKEAQEISDNPTFEAYLLIRNLDERMNCLIN